MMETIAQVTYWVISLPVKCFQSKTIKSDPLQMERKLKKVYEITY